MNNRGLLTNISACFCACNIALSVIDAFATFIGKHSKFKKSGGGVY